MDVTAARQSPTARQQPPVQEARAACYSLASHVHLCRIGAHILVLDVKQDRYRALPAAQTDCLRDWVEGWPGAHPVAAESSPGEDHCHAVAQQLVSAGILTVGTGRAATPVTLREPKSDLVATGPAPSVRPGVAGAISLIAGLASASLRLRRSSFEQLIDYVKARRRARAEASQPFDFELARSVIEQLRYLRPFCYTSRNACLFDSFASSELLSRRGMFPDWVFGVRATPFAAHCWLQHGDVVLNDKVEHVRLFTPIMIV